MGALAVDGLPALLWDRCNVQGGQLKESPHGRQTDGIKVFFETFDVRNGSAISKSAILSGATTVQEIKLSGKHQGWFRSGDKLVLGGRELLEHECLGHLPREKNTGHLHVYVKLSDLNSFDILSSAGMTYSYKKATSPQKSALTASLARTTSKSQNAPKSLVVRGQVLDVDTPLEHTGSSNADAVVHLVIRRPKVECQISQDSFELVITSSDNVETIKKKVEAQHGLLADSHSLIWQGKRLSASKSLASYGVGKGSVLELVPIEPSIPGNLPSNSPMLSSPQHELYEDWLKARAGLAAGQTPKLASSGTGGSYFIADTKGKNVAVFKPEDEEPMAVNNPKGHASGGTQGYRRGVAPGEGAVREVAAFLLDHGHFSGVPPTALVSCQELPKTSANFSISSTETKVGSLQAYVAAEGDCEERGTGIFPVEEVHKIAILDMRLANCDRNGGNILVKRCADEKLCKWQLIPIDHGYCLPSTFADISFEWMYWPQAAQPFSKKSKAYIAALDVDRDELTLNAHGLHLKPECNRIRKVCTMLLKKAAAKDLTPAKIAAFMCRDGSQKSGLEKIHQHALMMCKHQGQPESVEDSVYLHHVSDALDEVLVD